MSRESPLQPSPEQDAILAARHADPAGSLRVLAFAGKTTALRLLAGADAGRERDQEPAAAGGRFRGRLPD